MVRAHSNENEYNEAYKRAYQKLNNDSQKKMYFKSVFACALIAAVSTQTTITIPTASDSTASTTSTRRPSLLIFLQNAIQSMGSSARSKIMMTNSTAHTVTNMVKDGVQGFAIAGQQVVSTASGLGSSALKVGVDALKHGVDIGTNLAGILPGIGRIANMGGGIVKAGAEVANMVGQTGISLGNGIANGKLQLASGLTGAGSGLAANGVNMAANMADRGVNTAQGMANSAAGTISNLMDNAMNYVKRASNRVSSMATSVADRMSISAAAVPSSLNLRIGGTWT